jgi:hypothetical protein
MIHQTLIEIQPTDLAGILSASLVRIAPDGGSSIYQVRRILADLFVVG